ncbi:MULTISPECIES: HNH endonuclease family protein [unclassified Streptomyces]|uniref:HNH endonuclease family protein n=1 Tax=unclassified Streptomyces TaxID=2593676 RepID=UPI002966EC3E|nr:HNH endonuclease family protein [Streptomyces sp. SJL17-1]
MARQKRVGIASLAATLVLIAVAGCSAEDDAKSPSGGDAKPSPTRSGAAGGAPEADGTLPGVPTAEQARTELAGLEVAPHGSMSGYSRDRFPHWASQGENCNTRETVLNRDGANVQRDSECRAVSGTWASVYDDRTFKDAADLDIDHTVPLANAWRSGANKWTQDKRKEFANDLTHPQLLAVSAASNRSKGDQGPDEWQPPSKTYWCTYARAWTSVKATYELSVTASEKDMLGQMLDTCSS